MIEIPATASALLAELAAAPAAAEPAPAEPSAWDAPAERPIPDSVLYEPLSIAEVEAQAAALPVAQAVARQVAAEVQAAEQRGYEAAARQRIGRHIIVERTPDRWWLLLVAAGLVALGMGQLGGALLTLAGAAVAWYVTREG